MSFELSQILVGFSNVRNTFALQLSWCENNHHPHAVDLLLVMITQYVYAGYIHP